MTRPAATALPFAPTLPTSGHCCSHHWHLGSPPTGLPWPSKHSPFAPTCMHSANVWLLWWFLWLFLVNDMVLSLKSKCTQSFQSENSYLRIGFSSWREGNPGSVEKSLESRCLTSHSLLSFWWLQKRGVQDGINCYSVTRYKMWKRDLRVFGP